MTRQAGERLLLGGLVVLALLGVALVWWYAGGGMATGTAEMVGRYRW